MDAQARILLIDDDDLNLEVLQIQLESEGYQVRTAASGERGLEEVAHHPPDLILLDVRMRGMGGYATCAALKQNEATRHIPVLMVTGYKDKENVERIIEAGADDILFKPINSSIMFLRVRRMIYQKQLYNQLHG